MRPTSVPHMTKPQTAPSGDCKYSAAGNRVAQSSRCERYTHPPSEGQDGLGLLMALRVGDRVLTQLDLCVATPPTTVQLHGCTHPPKLSSPPQAHKLKRCTSLGWGALMVWPRCALRPIQDVRCMARSLEARVTPSFRKPGSAANTSRPFSVSVRQAGPCLQP